MSGKNTANTPAVALCPRCHFPINPRECFNIDFCMPARLPPPPLTTPVNRVPNQRRTGQGRPAPSLPPPQPENDGRSLSREPPSSSRRRESPPPPTRVANPTTSVRGKERRLSTASTNYSAEFDRLSINTEFETVLRQTEAQYFPQDATQTPASPTASSPSTEYSSISSTPDEPVSTPDEPVSPPVGRRWVVFRGRAPGIYMSPADATKQTEGFPDAFMLAFEDPALATDAFDRFLRDKIIPAHGRGPWVVFVGRKQGVFVFYDELRASVRGFPNNAYRCCENVEEGQRALERYLSKQRGTPALPPAASDPGPSRPPVTGPLTSHPAERHIPDAPKDESWWCCFAGAHPGVYMGIEKLTRAFPAPGGVRRVTSEEEGWELWTTFLADGKVQVVPQK